MFVPVGKCLIRAVGPMIYDGLKAAKGAYDAYKAAKELSEIQAEMKKKYQQDSADTSKEGDK